MGCGGHGRGLAGEKKRVAERTQLAFRAMGDGGREGRGSVGSGKAWRELDGEVNWLGMHYQYLCTGEPQGVAKSNGNSSASVEAVSAQAPKQKPGGCPGLVIHMTH